MLTPNSIMVWQSLLQLAWRWEKRLRHLGTVAVESRQQRQPHTTAAAVTAASDDDIQIEGGEAEPPRPRPRPGRLRVVAPEDAQAEEAGGEAQDLGLDARDLDVGVVLP